MAKKLCSHWHGYAEEMLERATRETVNRGPLQGRGAGNGLMRDGGGYRENFILYAFLMPFGF